MKTLHAHMKNVRPAAGPRTPEGKRVAARNATTHGLFARDVVLPHLGEDPRGYDALLAALSEQLKPRNMMEQHYVEKIAAASWRLRRLQRWQAQLFEDPAITEDEALAKLERVMRHETALHRQIDTSVKMLARELPKIFQEKVRAQLLAGMRATEKDCREDPYMNEFIVQQTYQRMPADPIPESVKDAPLDAAPADICQIELAALSQRLQRRAFTGKNPGFPKREEADSIIENCQNELASLPPPDRAARARPA